MKLKLIVFFCIVAIGILISTISLTKCKPGGDTGPLEVTGKPGQTDDPAISKSGGNPSSNPVATSKSEDVPQESADKVAQPKQLERFIPQNSPEAEVASIADLVANRDYEGFIAKVGDQVPQRDKARIKSLIEDPDFELDTKRPYWEVAKSAKKTYRWMLNFVPANGAEGATKTIQIDLAEVGSEGYEITRVMTPASIKEIAQIVSRQNKQGSANKIAQSDSLDPLRPVDPIGEAGVEGEEASEASLLPEVDSLTVAQAFTLAVLNEDFISARQLASGEVTDERIAGLMIALEDGSFSLREDRPLVVAFGNDTKSMVLSRVYSPKQNSEFAITLNKGGAWYVKELTFGKVIAALAKDADATYSPIVEDPEGGDSLVIYFEFDNSGLTSRADNQLRVVSNILQQDRDRRIRITGHADAKGSDDYNRQLSTLRATAIRDAIIARGANPEQVITEGYGESKPRKPNFNADGSDNPQGRTLNRRAEVYLDF